MAQQTQIDTLIPYYQRFIKAFPDVYTLANADEDDVLKIWQGLGYYSRAKNLHKAAKQIVDGGKGFPTTYDELMKLRGIGPYTAGAIASIAFNEKVAAVDGNVLRVISRFNDYDSDIGEDKTKKEITAWLEAMMPESSGDFNESLMELGALICTPTSPKCLICPVLKHCLAHANGTQNTLPVKAKKIKQKKYAMEVGIVEVDHTYYIERRPEKGVLAKLWGFPIIEQGKVPGEAIRNHLLSRFPSLSSATHLGNTKHVFTHLIWEMAIYHFNAFDADRVKKKNVEVKAFNNEENQLVSLDEIQTLALPVAFSKILPFLKQGADVLY